MPKKYIRRVRVRCAFTDDGNLYTNGTVVINELPIPGFTFYVKSEKNGKPQVLWPRVFVGGEIKLKRILPHRGHSMHVRSAFLEYIEAHPWTGNGELEETAVGSQEIEQEMMAEQKNTVLRNERYLPIRKQVREMYQVNPALTFEQIYSLVESEYKEDAALYEQAKRVFENLKQEHEQELENAEACQKELSLLEL
jgi:hypothetical protein